MFMDKAIRGQSDAIEADLARELDAAGLKRRRFERQPVRCPVRVRIGNRQYAAYLDNASDGGVKVSTGSRIIPAEKVVVQIPDLPPIKGELRWARDREAGVAFPLVEGRNLIGEWLERRADPNSDDDQ